jgi:hypothetical protein
MAGSIQSRLSLHPEDGTLHYVLNASLDDLPPQMINSHLTDVKFNKHMMTTVVG